MKSYSAEEHAVLNCISRILFEEDVEGFENCAFPVATVEAAARSFYDALAEKNHSQTHPPRRCHVLSQDNMFKHCSCNYYYAGNYSFVNAKTLYQPSLINNVCNVHQSVCQIPSPVNSFNYELGSRPFCPPNSYANSVLEGLFSNEQDRHSSHDHDGDDRFHSGFIKRKHLYRLESKSIGKRDQHFAVYDEDSELSEAFDQILLSDDLNDDLESSTLALQSGHEIMASSLCRESEAGPNRTRKRRKMVGDQGDLFDLRTLLINCAEAVAGNDQATATELLLRIRNKSSSRGNSSQRLAHYFANALEARLAGTGNEACTALSSKTTSVLTSLRSHRLLLSACPLIKASNFFVNRTILDLAEKATTLHIVHFGIMHGFQWPSLIKRLSERPGGPPLLRITGIDLPLPGPQPAAMLEQTGRCLSDYCRRFNVPFEYVPVAQRWENIAREDIEADKDEVTTVVVCLYRLKYLPDDTAGPSSARDAVLGLIKSLRPDMFVQGVANGGYNAPFFASRFKEALYYFSSVLDMADEASPARGGVEEDRAEFEEEACGREILNVVACEGARRVARPETYRQWRARSARAGLRQVPLGKEMVERVKGRMKSCRLHNDFLVDEDRHWMVLGWRGRVLYALSCWRP